MKDISILMPVYNVESYIEEAVKSILQQTFKNFELIIVDDYSTDATYERVRELAKKDDRIKIVRNETNIKICKSLNRAFVEAEGRYIARMDGDDISMPTRLEVLKEYLELNEEIGVVGSQLLSINEKGDIVSYKKYPRTNKFINKGNKRISSVPHFWLARREVYEILAGYREIPYAEDYDFLLRGELKGIRYANVEQYLYKMRLREGNTASMTGLLQRRAVRYVKSLHKRERRLQIDLFSETEYRMRTDCKDRSKDKYTRAYKFLNTAVTEKKSKIKMIGNVLLAMSVSMYIAEYIFDAMHLRGIIFMEDKIIPRIIMNYKESRK